MIKNGSQIVFKPEYADTSGEVFTVSQWDGNRGWAGDEHGFGWYFTANQVVEVEVEDEDDDFEDDEEEAYE